MVYRMSTPFIYRRRIAPWLGMVYPFGMVTTTVKEEEIQENPTPSVPALRCSRCNYVWVARFGKSPGTCANRVCRSPYWDKPRGWAKES